MEEDNKELSGFNPEEGRKEGREGRDSKCEIAYTDPLQSVSLALAEAQRKSRIKYCFYSDSKILEQKAIALMSVYVTQEQGHP
jgi:hypothetical protein